MARLRFGRDRLPDGERAAPAWPDLDTLERRRDGAYRRQLPHGAPVDTYGRHDTTAAREGAFQRTIGQARPLLRRLRTVGLEGWRWQDTPNGADAPTQPGNTASVKSAGELQPPMEGPA